MAKIKEIWKDIVGHDDYQISNFGRMKSLKYNKCRILKGCIILGYRHFNFSNNGITQLFKVHRAVAFAFIPNPQNKPDVNHIDGNRGNNHVSNLEWCTASENMQHAVRTGLIPPNVNGKKVICLKTKQIYPSAKIASSVLGYNHRTLCNMLNRKFTKQKNKTTLRYA